MEYLVSLGADGFYLDQLAMAAPRPCHDKKHGHGLYDWTDGYRKLLEKASAMTTLAGKPLNIMIEGCSDLYGDITDGQLVSTFSYYFPARIPSCTGIPTPTRCLWTWFIPAAATS